LATVNELADEALAGAVAEAAGAGVTAAAVLLAAGAVALFTVLAGAGVGAVDGAAAAVLAAGGVAGAASSFLPQAPSNSMPANVALQSKAERGEIFMGTPCSDGVDARRSW
jgi:hypothetical protein